VDCSLKRANHGEFMILKYLLLTLIVLAQIVPAFAQDEALDELNPYDSNVEETLRQMDEVYERETGKSAFLEMSESKRECYRISCSVWIDVQKASQTARLYVDGVLRATWYVSTGTASYPTPNFDRHPNGRIYDAYSSRTYPGGDYNGLGNMPYAVFISGGFAIHGTARSNWARLGSPASHGCIRLHPDNGYAFNRLVRQYGIGDTWITVR